MTADPQPEPKTASIFWRLVRYVRPYLAILLLAIAAGTLYAGARTARAVLIQPIFDDVLVPAGEAPSADVGAWWDAMIGATERPDAAPATPDEVEAGELPAGIRTALPRIALAALAIIFLLPLGHFGQLYLSQYVLGRVLVDIQQELCTKLLRLPLGFHHRTTRGETLSRVTNDAQRAHLALELLFSDVAQAVIALTVGIGTLLYISWQLTLTLGVVAPAIAGTIAFFGRRIRKSASLRQESQADVTQRLLQILSGIKVIKAFRAEEGEGQAFQGDNVRYFRRNMKVVKNRALSRAVVEGLTNTVGVAVLFLGIAVLGASLWGLTLGTLGAFLFVMQTTYRPMKEITKGWTRLQEALPSAERFFALLDLAPDAPDTENAVELGRPERGLRISKVSFSYGREPVLQDVSLDVQAGEVVAIVGKTGGGKTTLADLLLRLHDPDAGAIEVDGIDLRRAARASWLDQVAVVTQEPFLFAGTIGDNVRYGRPDATPAEVDDALRAAHVDEFVDRLPDGIETDVGEAGVQLSGGQRQRITIARAILKRPAVLIFDEATSSLDVQSERYVQEAIESLLRGRTVFIIAHRLSTIRHADKIVVLEDGRVAEHGNHDTLMARGGLYADLMSPSGAET